MSPLLRTPPIEEEHQFRKPNSSPKSGEKRCRLDDPASHLPQTPTKRRLSDNLQLCIYKINQEWNFGLKWAVEDRSPVKSEIADKCRAIIEQLYDRDRLGLDRCQAQLRSLPEERQTIVDFYKILHDHQDQFQPTFRASTATFGTTSASATTSFTNSFTNSTSTSFATSTTSNDSQTHSAQTSFSETDGLHRLQISAGR